MTNSYWKTLQSRRLTRRRVVQIAGGGAAAAFLAACGGSTSDEEPDSSSTGTATGTATPETANEDQPLAESQSLVNRFRNDLLTMDPAVIFGVEQEATAAAVYNGLTRFNVDTELEADLAEGWETHRTA